MNKEISPEVIAEMYISMTPEQQEMFWKMLTEELRRYYANKKNEVNRNTAAD